MLADNVNSIIGKIVLIKNKVKTYLLIKILL